MSFAGNDLSEIFPPATDSEKFAGFWRVSNTFLVQLYQSRLITIAALSGECFTSGCCFAICCDKRVAAYGARIGFTEGRLGLPVPSHWSKILTSIIGYPLAESHCLAGDILSAEAAYAEGLIDVVSPLKNWHM